jgi:Secretion system C-terminal sorting domain/FG-GAP-like repeat/Lamin Tail Domain
MKGINIFFACMLLCIATAKAQYETHLLSYTTLCLSSPDMDGDGDADILSAGFNNLQWQESLGNGMFKSHTITQSQTEVHAAVAADIDKDGDIDVITASITDNRIYWMENIGNEVFTSRTLTSSVIGAVALDVIDLDDDGDSDIVCAGFTDDKIYWLKNNGSQVFTLATIYSTFDGTIKVISSDLDADGDKDIVAASQLDSTVLFLKNNGSEVFTPSTIVNLYTPRTIRFSDLDNDLDQDILYASDGGCGWLENNLGVFTPHTIAITDVRDIYAIDMDGDSLKDIVMAEFSNEYISWKKNSGNQLFQTGVFIDSYLPVAALVTVADFNSDGFIDVVGASTTDTKLYTFSANQTVTKNRINRYLFDASYACHGDFDNDGDNDLLAVGYYNVNFYRNDSNGIFNTRALFPASVAFEGQQIRSADMDGDGDMDAVYSEYAGSQITWLENQGGGAFVTRSVYPLAGAKAVFPIDFDFDGDMDVVASTTISVFGAAIYWYENNGSEVFTQRLIDNTYWYPLDVFPVDYNKDGKMDVIGAYAGSGGNQQVILHLNTGTGYTSSIVNTNASGVNSVFAIDLDRDNDVDILSASFGDNKIIWYENPGHVQRVVDNNAQGATYVYAADLDGDGDIDIASTSRTDNEINWYRNGGNQGYTKVNIAENVPDPEVIIAGDLDNDSVLELYSTCSSSESVAYYKLPPPPPPLVLTDCSELLFSEYIEGSSFNKAIEIYNPTANAINLTDYQITVHSSGNVGANQTLNLVGTIAPYSTFVAAHSSAIPGILNRADTLFGFSFNGDDALALRKNGALIDIIGTIGQDPGTEWSVGGVSTLNRTLVRKPNAATGNNLNPAFDPSLQWISYATDDTTKLGNHSSLCTTYCPPSISILASQDTICPNELVIFSSISANEGTMPSYQWKKNGLPVGTNSSSYMDSTLINDDVISCVMTSNSSCVITPNVTSNSIVFKVKAEANPTILITNNGTSFCDGQRVDFTAAITNGGTSPSYQWKKNNMNVGNGTASYSDSLLVNLDIVSCFITSNDNCVLNPTALSNFITVIINPILTPSVTIGNNVSAVCYGSAVNFISTILNGGTSPAYQWKLNGIAIPNANLSNLTFYPLDSSYVSLSVLSNATCISTTGAVSDSVLITILPIYIPDISIVVSQDSICSGTLVNFTALPINEGPSPAYIWRKNLGIVGNNSANYSSSLLANGDVVSLQMTGSLPCSNTTALSNDITMTVSTFINTPTIQQNGNTLSTSAIPGVSYQWFDCNNGNLPIVGAVSASYIPVANGSFGVSVANLLCANVSDSCFNYTGLAISNVESEAIVTIHPNPGNGIFNLTFKNLTVKTLEVVDLLGRTVYNNMPIHASYFNLDLSACAKGQYFLNLYTDNEKIVRRIVVE